MLRRALIALLALGLLGLISFDEIKPPVYPDGEQLITHARDGLGKFWMQDSARGTPVGNFPTFRCNDGALVDPDKLCKELKVGWISEQIDGDFTRDYTRMKSRQIYAYSMLYHLTGDAEALRLAKAGVDYLLSELRDSENGGFISYRVNGEPGLSWRQRTTQDQAYAMLGLAAYYYVTRDTTVEQVLLEEQAFIFANYRDDESGHLLWVLEDSKHEKAAYRELVGPLDQINAYMLLVTPLLPEPHQSKWREDLRFVTNAVVTHYHDAERGVFWGGVHSQHAKTQGRNNDHGHTVKSYWMTYLSGLLLGEPAWQALGYQGMKQTIARAAKEAPVYQWENYLRPGTLEHFGRMWKLWHWETFVGWEWNELDQSAITISLLEPGEVVKYLDETLPFFMLEFTDPEFGSVGQPDAAKQHHWKNGYHEFEHALIGYLGAQAWHKKPATLYFALQAGSEAKLAPYYFQAETTSIAWGAPLALSPLAESNLVQVAASFSGIRP